MKKLFVILSYCIFYAFAANAQGWMELGTGVHSLNANYRIGAIATDTGGIVYAAGGFTNSDTIYTGRRYVAKWDGVNWHELGTGLNSLNANGFIVSICVDKFHNVYAGGLFRNSSGKCYVAKWDGSRWSELGTGSNALNANNWIISVCSDNLGNIYAAGYFTDSLTDTTGNVYVAKWDGSRWSKLGASTAYSLGQNSVFNSVITDSLGNVYTAGYFTHSTSSYASVIKWDGASWSQLGSGPFSLNTTGGTKAMCLGVGGKVYTAGTFQNPAGKVYLAEWDGANWSEIGAGGNELNKDGFIASICNDSKNNIYVGVNDTGGFVTMWNGLGWVNLDTGSNGLKPNAEIWALNSDKSDNIYSAGDFTDSVSKYSGSPYVAKLKTNALSVNIINDMIKAVEVYPNPTTGQVNIEIDDRLIGSHFSFSDCTGKVLISGHLKAKTSNINIGIFPAGIYFLKINDIAYKIEKQ
jgi:hypothetical protein